ncbi:MAG TPA: zf-HC2 domain-containing protein [Streptomyces sp.]|nr:zf-HC2 domain-containing protein [Streptomyces sp.]
MNVPQPSGGAHVRLQLGAYVLDALSPGEDAQVAFHLGRCDVCRAAYLEVADAPALLALFSESDLAPDSDEQ